MIKIKKESFAMFYQLVFGVIALWLVVIFPKVSLVPIFVLGVIVFMVRYKKLREEELK